MSQAAKYTLQDLLDIPQLQGLLNTLDEIHSLPSAIIDTEGNILTATAWQDICTKFHRANPETELLCKQSDVYLASRLDELLPQAVYRCPLGLVDTATPIIVEGEHLGNVFTGQLFTSPPDEERFVRQAQQYGFDEGDYLGALRRVPIVPEELLYKNLAFLGRFAEMLATQGLVHKREMETTAALRESEERYRHMFESHQAIMLVLDPQSGAILDANRAAQAFYGYGIVELRNMSTDDINLLPPDEVAKERSRALREERNYFVFPHRLADGSVRTVEVRSSPVDLNGTPVLYSMIQDITERKRAEAALAESERKLRLHVRATPVAVIEWDANFRVTSWNPAAERIFGYSASEAIGQHSHFIVPEDTRPLTDAAWAELLERSGGERSTNENVTKDGRILVCEWFNTPITSADGTIIGVASIAEDVTTRFNAEKALQEASRLLDETQALAHLGGWEADVATGRVTWTDEVYRIYGVGQDFDPSDVRRAVGFYAPEHVPVIEEAFRRARDFGEPYDLELEFVRADGRHIWVRTVGRPVIVNGQVVRITGNIADITDRKQIEERLRQSEARFRRLADNAPDLIYRYELGPNRGFSFVSPVATALTGYTPDDHYRDPDLAFKLVHPHDRGLLEAVMAGEIEPGQSTTVRWVRKDGEVIWIEQRNVPVLDSDGNTIAIEGIARDITERKRTGEALARSEARIRLVFENMVEGFSLHEVITDEDGEVVDFRFLDANDAHERLTGLKHDEVVGRTMLEIAPGADRNQIAAYGKVALTGEPYSFEYESKTFGKYLRVHAFSPQRGMFATVFDDRTEQKKAEAEKDRLEAQLRQSQKLEAVGQLAAGIAHDFNNKLAVILGSADMAMGEPDCPDSVRADIEEIRTAAWRSADLTRQLLAFARMQPIAPKQIDLNETLESMLAMLRRLTGEEIDLKWEPDPQPCRVRMDPGQIDQALVNLVVNARDAISGSGTVHITTTNVRADSDFCAIHVGASPGRYVVLEVADDGHGMDVATKARIFEPFFTTKPQGMGTGLGLATVHGIAYQNHGFVEVESELGKGTAVRIYLPQDPHEVVATDEMVPAARLKASETVLVVEDEPALLKLTARMLERLGFTVLASESPFEAVQLAAGHSGGIDLLVTDVVMPGMNGSELQRLLRTERPSLRCLYVSGYPAKVLAETGVLDDGVDLLPKPYSEESLAMKIREVLARC